MNPQTPDNEVEKTHFHHESYCRKCNALDINNEVDRLRELLNRAIEIAETLSGGGSRACRELHHSKKDRHEYGEVCPVEERLEKAASDLARLKAETQLAPAPEEPVTGLCLICHEKQTTCSSGLCEECQKPEEPVTHPLMDCQVCGDFRGHGHECAPAPEEPTTEESSVTESQKWFPANPPLEKELRYIEHRGTSLPDTRSYIAQALRYLRDEIQKLNLI